LALQLKVNAAVISGGPWELRVPPVFVIYSDEGQDIAEYAVMVSVILLIVVATVRLIGSNANTVFSQVASSIG
jgi:Flp pilus assembly pilin Flp